MTCKTLLALFAAVLIGVTAARAGGPEMERSATIKAGGTHTYTLTFRGGEKAVMAVIGDGSTDLDVFVYDEDGDLVAFDDDDDDDCVVLWRPARTGKFIVKVVNRGDESNRYNINSN